LDNHSILKKDTISVLRKDKKLIANKKKFFIGKVLLHDISQIIKSREQKIYMVNFHNDAKTKLHYHESGQTLIVTKGNGSLSIYKKIHYSKKTNLKIKQLTKILLKKGDVVYIPRFTLHWHGGTKNTKFAHIAINPHSSSGKESKTTWFESDFNTFEGKIS
jgi:quercetin dioxygenase-like cupin family protein